MDDTNRPPRMEQLRGLIRQEAARRRRLVAAESLGVILAAACVLVMLFVILDALVWIPSWLAWSWDAALLGLAAAGIATGLTAWLRRESAAATALRLERLAQDGTQRNLLVNAVQMTDPVAGASGPAPAVLVEAMLGKADWDGVMRLRFPVPGRLVRALWVAAAMFTLLAGAAVFAPERLKSGLARLSSPSRPQAGADRLVLRRVMPESTTVRSGDTVVVQAEVLGFLEKWGKGVVTLEVRGANRPAQQLVMTGMPGAELAPVVSGDAVPAHRLEARIPQIYQPCEYRVRAGQDRSAWFKVGIAAPPALVSWEAAAEPPAYLGLKPFQFGPREATAAKPVAVPAGSKLTVRGQADTPLQTAVVAADATGRNPAAGRCELRTFAVTFTAADAGSPVLTLTGSGGLANTVPLPVAVVPDQIPVVRLAETPLRIKLPPLGRFAVVWQARDDRGLKQTGLEAVGDPAKGWRPLRMEPAAGPKAALELTGTFMVQVAELNVPPGQRTSLRVFAEDGRPDAARQRGYSPVLEISVEEPQQAADARKKAEDAAKTGLASLIRLQQETLQGGEKQVASARKGTPLANAPLQALHQNQRKVREQAQELIAHPDGLGELAGTLAELEKKEMPEAVRLLEEAAAAGVNLRPLKLEAGLPVQRVILTRLTGIQNATGQETLHENRRDVVALFRQVCGGQQKNLAATAHLVKGDAPPEVKPPLLAKEEDVIASQLSTFLELSATLLEAQGEAQDDGFADVLRQVRALMQEKKVYEGMVLAAEALEGASLPPALERQKEILKQLLLGLDLLNRWNVKSAKEIVSKAEEKLKEMAAALADLEKQQKGIVEATNELGRQGKMDAGIREKLKEMDKQQEAMKDLIEKLANDLFQFPELPVANELNGKMREIFEDVQQAMNSANEPSVEIAVQKEDALLDAIRSAKERVKDVEMWLPDVPDNINWNMEAFDADEFPNMPLVPLPDELEDIVGQLLDQAKDIEEKSQDTTGNNMMADAEMGWAIMDGPMPNFSAKGKSGNMKPNDNEMTGRSGAGREGQSNGEVVENKVKGLEGRETGARFTKDPFQKGQVEEADDSTMNAKATGGGKLGGESESVGLFGQAPRRDQGMADHAGKVTPLRRETEAMYTKARLLYLESGGLGQAARGLREIEDAARPEYGSLSRKVIKHLQTSQVELASGSSMPLALEGAAADTAGRNVWGDADLDQIKDESYREMLKEYYRNLGEAGKSKP